MAARRRIDAACAIRRRAAPDALVSARTVPVDLVGGVYAAVPITRAAAPLAVLFVVTMLVDLVRTVYAAMSVACTAAMPTFACHFRIPFLADILSNFPPPCRSKSAAPLSRPHLAPNRP